MKRYVVVLLIFPLVLLIAGHIQVTKQFSITVLPESTLAPMGFMLTTASPSAVKSGGAPVAAGTDFYGLPIDREHPSMGAIQWHEPTPDYTALVKKILMSRSLELDQSHRDKLKSEIEALFLAVYGFPMSEAGTHYYTQKPISKKAAR